MAINEKQKWPTNKKQHDINWIKIFGKQCPACKGGGIEWDYPPQYDIPQPKACENCGGLGKVEK